MVGAPTNESASARSVARISSALNAEERRRAAADDDDEEEEEEKEDEEDAGVSSSKVMTRTACRTKNDGNASHTLQEW
jgi:hypothetical protein